MLRTFSLVAALMLAGCAGPRLVFTVHSDPEGAVIFEGGRRIGYAPQTLYYPITDDIKAAGRVNFRDLRAQWASGAIADVKNPYADTRAQGLSQELTILRPNVAGRDVDARFALDLERNKLMQDQATALRDAANAAAVRQMQPQNLSCTSTQNLSGTVSTRCN